MKKLDFTADQTDDGATLAAAVRRRTEASWETVRRWVRAGKVTVAGARETDPTRRLRKGDAVAMDPAARRVQPPPAIRIVFEDNDVVVVDKPSGVSSVPYEERETGTAMDLVRATWKSTGRKGGSSQPLMIVHRIDKETSGLLVYAKNKGAERALAAQFRAHTVDRTYLCVAHGRVDSRRIESELVRDRGDGLRGSGTRGKRAVTHVEKVRSLRGATLCRVRLETGKTHQIRIHMSESAHPLVGEKVYIRDYLKRGGEPMAAPRLLLHAATLGFVHPRTGAKVHFES
ncbi:MAG TPA: RluA family pseudouridine synthase, partial [Candidatus Cybelea sp.]|nr:RluA family pseudouridine synthase [Candidatus Cybelea sp.]